ncbi:hypothetical protein [uncultured Porphyromonas sp.]|uniref:hypothetical protein n=1 Tax=uncultured Porphyromonas sp. TaxID=159274 RepID=UPI002805B9AF|nr:hypothetical protein [uncultured Porphyromonas sp.]
MYDITAKPHPRGAISKGQIARYEKKLPQVLAVFRKSCTFASQFRREAPVALQNEA